MRINVVSALCKSIARNISFATYEYLDARVCRPKPRISAEHRYELIARRRDSADRASLSDQYLVCQHKSVEHKIIFVNSIDTEFSFTQVYIV